MIKKKKMNLKGYVKLFQTQPTSIEQFGSDIILSAIDYLYNPV